MKTKNKCINCGGDFHSYNKNPKYCSISCKAIYQSRNLPFEEAKLMYECGMTQDEIAIHYGVSQKAIHGLFKRFGYKCRVAAKRNQYASNNSSWRGDLVTYSAYHYRVESVRGKPNKCSICDTESANRYEWANLTGDYADVGDYARMCASCHRKYDKKRRKETGRNTISVKR